MVGGSGRRPGLWSRRRQVRVRGCGMGAPIAREEDWEDGGGNGRWRGRRRPGVVVVAAALRVRVLGVRVRVSGGSIVPRA
jgi:hypothetical protein